ncbi:MAG: DUF4292 domain-containing protein, partial [Deltaproteobacteria bacterium]|nr:DUF4292 domain-containing protein [Deltaproteobacteria bacterium]
MKARIIHLIFLCAILILSCACARPLLTIPKTFTAVSTEDLLKQLEKRKHQFKDLRARVSLSLQSTNENYSFQEALLMQPPVRMRMEILSPFGTPLIYMTTNEKSFSILDVGEKKLYRGAPSAENLAKLVGLPVRPQELINILSGNFPELNLNLPVKLVFMPDQNVYQLEASDYHDADKWKIWLRAADYLPVRMALISKDDHLIYDIYYEDFKFIKDYNFPQVITIMIPPEDKTVS